MVDFVDNVNVHLIAGNGGNGVASIRREKFKPLAGPNGGNGGNGGSIILRSTKQSTSLLNFHFSRKHHAENGSQGLGGDKDGTRGKDLVLDVPVGTVVKYLPTGKGAKPRQVFDFDAEGIEWTVCKGGQGGLGNAALANSQRKAPGFALLGTPGEEAKLIFELKLLADIALVGFPSAGKSSIIAAISAARPKIADYPFTTLTPNLGVVSAHNQVFTVADVPGLIPGAASGKGLGLEFLRHIERTSVIVHVVDMNTYESGRDPMSDYEAINAELSEYDKLHSDENNKILTRPQLIVLNKVDDSSARDLAELAKDEFVKNGINAEDIILTSAATHEGMDALKNRLASVLVELNTKKNKHAESNAIDLAGDGVGGLPANLTDVGFTNDFGDDSERKTINITPLKVRNSRLARNTGSTNDFSITHVGGIKHEDGSFEGGYYEITSEKLRNWVLQTDFANDEAVGYLADRLAKIGVEDQLEKMGAKEHDEVRIVTKNLRAPYLISEREFYIFNYEPMMTAGEEMLYSNIRGQDTRLEMHERAQRATRKEKRDAFHARQDERAKLREQFDKEREAGYWADPDEE